jgi:hypothetical protein
MLTMRCLATAEAVQGTAVSYTRCLANASAGRWVLNLVQPDTHTCSFPS